MADKLTSSNGASSAPPSDEDIARARKASVARSNLDKAREKLKAKRELEKKSEEEKPTLSAQTLEDGCRALVRFVYFLAGLGAWIAGGKLAPLDDADVTAGAQEAVPLVRRFTWLAFLLSFIGFPLWLARTIAAKFSADKKPVDEKPATSTPANVTQLPDRRLAQEPR